MANLLKKEREKYHIFRSPFVTDDCVCRSPKYLFSSGACEGCLKTERRVLICSFRDLVCAHPDIPDRMQESLWTKWIVPFLTNPVIGYPANVPVARVGMMPNARE
jgi:hypothetical protein